MRLPVVLVLIAALAAGCGDDEPEPAQQTPPTQQPQPRPTPPSEAEAVSGEAAEQQATEREPEAQPQPAAAGDQTLYTVQVAAFLDAATAREWAGRLRSQDLPAWVTQATVDGRSFHRLRIGAVPELDDARRLGRILRDRFHWPVWVAPLTSADRLPVNAVPNTREILRGG